MRALPKTAPGLVSAAAQATTYLSLKNCAQPYFIERIESPTHGIDSFNPRIRLLVAPGGRGHRGRAANTALPPPANRTGPPPFRRLGIDHRMGAVTAAGLAGTSAGAPFDVKATRDGPIGPSVLEEEVEAVMGPFSHCHEKRDDDAIQSARRSLTESDVGGRANIAPSTPAVVASSPLPPTHGGAGGFRRRRS